MTRKVLVASALLLCACKTVPQRGPAKMALPAAPPPAWTNDVSIFVEQETSAGVGGGDLTEQTVASLPEALTAAGFKVTGAKTPGALVLRVWSPESHFNSIEINYSLTRDGAVVDEAHFDSGQMPCGANTGPCAAKVIVGNLETAAALAQVKPKAAAAPALQGRLAVLELRNETGDLREKDVRYFTDVVRAGVLRLQPNLEVMTRENLLVLLKATGKDLASCEGECEVDTGRRIGADQIVSGELVKIGTRYKMTLRLHETHDGRLLGAAVASGATIDELDESANKAVAQLFGAR